MNEIVQAVDSKSIGRFRAPGKRSLTFHCRWRVHRRFTASAVVANRQQQFGLPRIFLVLLFFALQLPARILAQVKFFAVCANNQIDKSEYLKVQYVVENAADVEQIVPPVFKNFF